SGNPVAKTPTNTWWGNSVIAANSGGSLNSEGVIYIVTMDPSANYTINADKVGLVIQPGLEMTGAGGGSSIYADGFSYVWFEGKINISSSNNGILWDDVSNSVMRAAHVRGTALGSIGSINLRNCPNNRISNIRIANAAAHGLVLNNSSYNTVSDVITTNSNDAGIYLTNSHHNRLAGVITANNDNASNADGGGMLFAGSADNTVVNATIVNNRLSGFALSNSPNNILMNIVGANNYTSFYIVNNSNKITAANLVMVDNSRHGVYLNNVSNNNFTGILKIGNNGGINCRVSDAPTAPGLISTSCTDTGLDGSATYAGQLSDAILETGSTTSSSFIGKVLVDDAANASDSNGDATFAEITDWLNFENNYRSWGLNGDPFPSLNNKGPLPSCDGSGATNETECITNIGTWRTDGRIWDWSLALGDIGDNGGAVLHQVLVLPSADDTITHTWSDTTTSTFLKHAVEILGDAIGNDDGLCESNEACIYTPNIASYQGEGNLISAGPFMDSMSGGLTGVILYQYETNGH
ncbi:right-handed parallel beta-helix repeat-containing protein, partial [Kaarinaea lacus]